jgi:hypothetical protein
MSVLALILASAEGAEEHSKTAFYVAGGLLAVWAVLISLVGVARPSFPGKAGGRVLMLLTVLLVAGAASTAVITA